MCCVWFAPCSVCCRRRRFRPASSVPSPRNCSPLSQTWATVKHDDSSASNWRRCRLRRTVLILSTLLVHSTHLSHVNTVNGQLACVTWLCIVFTRVGCAECFYVVHSALIFDSRGDSVDRSSRDCKAHCRCAVPDQFAVQDLDPWKQNGNFCDIFAPYRQISAPVVIVF